MNSKLINMNRVFVKFMVRSFWLEEEETKLCNLSKKKRKTAHARIFLTSVTK